MGSIPQSVLDASHDSYALCDWCGAAFLPRVKRGPNRSRFCRPGHKDAYWNSKKENPPGAKIFRILAILASGRSLNRFEAQKAANDHVLNSTIAEIHNRLRIRVSRKHEVFQFRGKPVRVMRYSLGPKSIKRAARYLERADKLARADEH